MDGAQITEPQTSGPRPAQPRRGGRRTRICFITVEFHGFFRNGGIGTSNTALALALAAHGFDVTVAIANADEAGPRLPTGNFAQLQAHYANLGITLDYVRPHPHIAGSFDDARTASYCVYLYVKDGGFDTVLFNDNAGQGYFSLLAKHTGVFENAPLMCVVAHGPVEWVHELNAQEYYDRRPIAMAYLERRSAALADLLISPSRYLLDWMIERGWLKPGQGHVLQNLIGAARAPAPPQRPTPIREIVFFGRHETRKGISLFCDAIEILNRTEDLGAVTVTFLGKFGKIGAIHSGVYIAERARQWRATPRILAVYAQEEALAYLARPGTLAVIPSRAENSPCVVAECLELGIPFLATATGGTAELVAPEDRETCLFPPDPEILASRLQDMLHAGHRPAGLAVPQAETLKQWIRLLSQPRQLHTKRAAEPLVSACLAWSDGPEFNAGLAALEAQADRLAIIIAGGPTPANVAIRHVPGEFTGPGAARNAAAAVANGDYLMFINETTAVAQPEAVAVLAKAAACTGADVLTCLRLMAPGLELERPDIRERDFPIGACIELGAVENCFGEGIILVRRARFAGGLRFSETAHEDRLDWLFLVTAAHSGAVLELVPAPLARLRDTATMADGERTVDAHREILRAYAAAPMATAARLLEINLRIPRANRFKMQRALETLRGPARDIAIKLSGLEASSKEAGKLFMNYCCERRMVALALDFAMHNDVAFLPETLNAAKRANTEAAFGLLRTKQLDLRHKIDLTSEFGRRAWPFHGLRREDLAISETGALTYAAPAGDSIIKLPAFCPSGTTALEVTAQAGASLDIAAVLCLPWARPVLSQSGIAADDTVWWSGWTRTGEDGQPVAVALALPGPRAELLDLYLLVRRPDTDNAPATAITWQNLQAELSLNGDITPSGIEMAALRTALAPDFLSRGEVLTDLTGINFRIFVPGTKRALLHPVINKLALVRVRDVLPAGALGLGCMISIENDKSHPIEFGIWLRPGGAPAADPEALGESENFSGWILLDASLKRQNLTLRLAAPAGEMMDIYLATRVKNQPDAYFCHAYWQDFFVLENSMATAPLPVRQPVL